MTHHASRAVSPRKPLHFHSRYKALIFDCDGVLVDTEPLHCLSWQEVFRSHGLEFSEDFIMGFVGLSSPQTLRILQERSWIPREVDCESWIQEKRMLFYRFIEEKMTEIPGISPFLRKAAKRMPIAMATGSPRNTYERVLRRMQWGDVFDVLVGADDVSQNKPDPEIYLTALERLGMDARDCLAFEDSLPGVEAARAAGLDVVGIASSKSPDALLQKGAKAVVQDFADEEGIWRLIGGGKEVRGFGFEV